MPPPLEPLSLEPLSLEPLSIEPLEPLSLEPLSLEPLEPLEPLSFEPEPLQPPASSKHTPAHGAALITVDLESDDAFWALHDEVEVLGEKTWAERDAELRDAALNLEDDY